MKPVRDGAKVLAFLMLFGGYAFHQYNLLAGQLAVWTIAVSRMNIIVGWLLLGLALVLSSVRDKSETPD